jgi:hypothetical protein
MGIIKVIGRTLVFLLAAVIVLAGVSALNSAGVLSSAPGSPPEVGFQPNSAAQTSTEATASTTTQPNFERGEGDYESEGFSLTGLTTVAKNLGQMSLIVAIVALLTRAIKLIDKRRMTAAGA